MTTNIETSEKKINITPQSGEKVTVGIDIGSTTVKLFAVADGVIIYENYERHLSLVRKKTLEMIKDAADVLKGSDLHVAVSGSAGLGLADASGLLFVQEVFATGETVKYLAPDTSTVIELGGEDAKIIFFKGGVDERMNGSCAGGTGAFIDQMATLLAVTPNELDELSMKAERIYPIASRCGVFAKTDIQPLLNQGARKEDVAASIYRAVVNQTIAGLAQGRKIEGKVMFLGGPLYYCKGLRRQFTEVLGLSSEDAVFPEYSLYAVAIGASLYASKNSKAISYDELVNAVEGALGAKSDINYLPPLFKDQAEYNAFAARHAKATVPKADIAAYSGQAYLGIDCGSTTTKLVLITSDKRILYTYYSSNRGNPVDIIKEQLVIIRGLCGDKITIKASAVTGYGEELIKNAFRVDFGIVETMAHYTAARHFDPEVDFIIDIGGQDIKCFKIHGGGIDSIILNEACSSGCGSFIETFAKSMGYTAAEFASLGLFAKAPVDLGSRCTVFMNSSVKQAQKDGADVSDISAGLSGSVIKNAVYKVIRAGSADELGRRIVVQGGTFLNDAVLRSFETELGRDVIRPSIAGLMGAYGAALYAVKKDAGKSTLLDKKELDEFTHTSKSTTCGGCENHCNLTVNTFSDGKRYISGNQCERGAGLSAVMTDTPNLYRFKRERLDELIKKGAELQPVHGTIGLPLSLGMFELAELWYEIFASLGFRVLFSGVSTRAVYSKGQYSIPSDTACYPAKLMHGHIETLIEKKPDAVFYPALTYNFDEGAGDNHYNCPVVAYYAELLRGNMESLRNVNFLYPYLNVNDKRSFARSLYQSLHAVFGDITQKEVSAAVESGVRAYHRHMEAVRAEGKRAIDYARENGKRLMILAGRPYHIDPEICHGIDKLAQMLGFVVLSEDSVADNAPMIRVGVLNQWTYHSRLYRAAEFAAYNDDIQLVQLVSFGCGLDAITTDEVRAVLESRGKLYTQIKIDEITNLGAVRIRLRSLIGALEERGL